MGGVVSGLLCAGAPAIESTSAPGLMINSARVPFVANEGQVANTEVKYYARTFGGTVYALSDGRIVYSLPKYGAEKNVGSAVVVESLRGAFQSEPVGSGKSAAAVNSFIGNRPEKWKSNLPAFDRLDFGEVYEGVNLLLSARGNNVEKIFVLSPGADPREIALGFEGVSHVEITADGRIELLTALGPVYFTRPVAWQVDEAEQGTVATKRDHPFSAEGYALSCPHIQTTPVKVAYALDEDGTVRFELGPYDQNKVLVIDPLLASTFVGGGGADAVQAMAVDSQTNVYVAGWTYSADFPVSGSYCATNAGGYDAFVSKFNANLGTLLASTYLGGSSNDQATAIGIDASSRIWLAGYTESTNFPASPSSPMCSTNNGGRDAFVAVLPANLGAPLLATYLGGSNTDYATAIAMDNSSFRQYVVGYTESANFPATNSTGYRTNYNGEGDAFVALFSNDVTRAAYKTAIFLGGTNADEAAGVVVSPGNGITNFVYVVGSTSSTNFPVTNGYQMTNSGFNDAFVSKLSVLLTNLPASTFLGGTADDEAYAVGFDISNRVYVAGSTRSVNFPIAKNPYSSAGGQDVFVSCLTNSLKYLYASTYIGGTSNDVATCLVVDSNTNRVYVYLAGYTSSTNFPTTSAAYDRSYNRGSNDAFTLRFDGRLTNLYASTYLGGEGDDQALALALAPSGNTLFVAGITASITNFPASDAAYETAFRGGASDGFVTKFPASLAYGTLKWRKHVAWYYSSPVITWDGSIAVGISDVLYNYNREGVETWHIATTSSVASQSPTPYAGLGVPAVGTNNHLYFNTQNGYVHEITSAGAYIWTYLNASAAVDDFWSSVALGTDGKCFASKAKSFHAIGTDGVGLWATNWPNVTENLIWASAAISSSNTIYTANYNNPKLYAFNQNGSNSHVWNMGGLGGFMYSSPALDSNGMIYAAASNMLYAFYPDGGTACTWTVGSGDSSLSSPAIGSNGVIYVGGGSNLYSFNTNGSAGPVWRTAGAVKSSPAIAADGSIIVGSADGFVYSFNPDGTTNWTCDTSDAIHFQSPLIDSEGTIYISDDGALCAIYGSAPPADSAWPMFRHDALRTGNQGMNVANFLKPTGLSVSKYGTFTNHVSWNASSNALNYELWRSTNDSTAGATRIRRLTQTYYNDSSLVPGKIYYYWLKVKTPVALSEFSASSVGGIPPLPPEGVDATKGIPTNYVQVSWQASANAAFYHVYRSNISNDTNNATLLGPPTPAPSTNYNDTNNVQPGLRYYYWVKASNGVAGISGFSSNGPYGGIPFLSPSGLSASQGASISSVALSWNLSTNATSYVVYRNTENNATAAGIITNTSGSQTNENDSTGIPLCPYYYWLKVTNEFGLSGYSASAIGWSLLAPPSSVSASAGTFANMIRVSWVIGSADATAHVIFRSLSPDVSTAVRQSEVVYYFMTDTNYDDTAIIRGPDYYYWVAALNNYGTSSLKAASAPGGTIPVTPSDLNATDGTLSNAVQVTWTTSPGATSYTVFRGENYSSPDTQLGSVLTNYYDDTSALHGFLYYYWVKAGNRHGLSPLSTFNSGWRGMVPPESISADNGTSTREVIVTWSSAPDALSYELWRGTSVDSASASKLANNVTTPYSDQSANPGTVYYYRVKSKRGTYSSAFSESAMGYRAVGMLDIAVSDFVFVPTVFGPLAHPAAVSFKVSNLSAIDMVEPNNTVQYDLYLSQNAIFGGGDDYWIGGSAVPLPLTAGASTRVVSPASVRASITIPSGIAGSYYVFIFVNHCLPSGWLDQNLANNSALRVGGSIRIASTTALQPVWNDYDGDGKTDFAVYQLAQGGWRFWFSTLGYIATDLTGFGGAGYRAVPRDYDGDGKFDLAVYQSASGGWRICLSASDYQMVAVAGVGGAGQSAVPADYDGDGKVDLAVYQAGTWRLWLSGSGYTEFKFSGLGGAGWRPVPADYDGDGRADPAVYQESAGTWLICFSASGYQKVDVINCGGPGQLPVPADYDGDGRVDPAVYNKSMGSWRFWLSGSGYQESSATGWGGDGQTAVPGDYDGDGCVDPVVYWESMGIWRLWLSSGGYSEIDVLAPGGVDFKAITVGE